MWGNTEIHQTQSLLEIHNLEGEAGTCIPDTMKSSRTEIPIEDYEKTEGGTF